LVEVELERGRDKTGNDPLKEDDDALANTTTKDERIRPLKG
jgi:hypothetical protein